MASGLISGSCKRTGEGEPIRPGTLSADGGRFAFKAVEQAVRLALAGRIAAHRHRAA